jgi:hypothetical protein
MSIVESLKTYLSGFPGLAELAPVHVDGIEPEAVNYSIDAMPGARVLETDILGNRTREYPFAFSSREITVDDLARISNNGFFEALADWLDEQTDAGNLPDLGARKASEKIEATSWGYLYQRDQNDQTGIYQIICKLTYTETKG